MKYRAKPRTVSAARYTDRYGTVERAEWEGFCLQHHLAEQHHGTGRRWAPSVPPGWTEIWPGRWNPWVVVDTAAGTTAVHQLTDEQFSGQFDPAGQAGEARREALITWARHQLAGVDAGYLRSSASDLDRPPWADPVLRAERERITALVTASGLRYDETFDSQHPDRKLRKPATPTSFRVTAETAAVLEVFLSRPGEQLTSDAIAQHSGVQRKAGHILWRLKQSGWAATTEFSADSSTRTWWLTETGAALGRERLARRARNAC